MLVLGSLATFAASAQVQTQPQNAYPQPIQPQFPNAQQPQAPTAAQQGFQQPAPGYYNGATPVVGTPVVPQTYSNTAAPPTSLPPIPPQLGPNKDEFTQLKDDEMGMTPAQIREWKKMYDERQRAAAGSGTVHTPKSVTGSISVSLSPGSTPPMIRPAQNKISSFVVVDSTGAPWPVENFRVGDKEQFPVERLDGPQGSSFTIDSAYPYGQSNLVLKLAGVATPVVINLIADQAEYDSRTEVRIQGRGPNSVVTSGSVTRGADSRLLEVLDGVAPSGKAVKVEGLDGVRAWITDEGKFVVRSPYKIITPTTREFATSADGTTVYVFDKAATKLLVMADGDFYPLNVTSW